MTTFFPGIPGEAAPGAARPGDPQDSGTPADLKGDHGVLNEGQQILVSDSDTGHFTTAGGLRNTIGVSGGDTGSFADGGESIVIRVAKSDSDSFTASHEESVLVTGSGPGPAFPLIFQMGTPAAGLRGDTGTGTEGQSVTALVYDTDAGSFTEASNFPGGPGTVPVPLTLEAFSIRRLGVLMPGTQAQAGTLYGVRSAQVSPQWVTTVTSIDDTVALVWNAPGKVTLAVAGGFLPWDILALIYGTEISSSGLSPADFYSLPLYAQHNSTQFSLVAEMTAKDSTGRLRTLIGVLYQAWFGPLAFSGPVYKNGLECDYSAQLVLSSTDETGQPLTDRAYGRLDPVPSGAGDWLPPQVPPVLLTSIRDQDYGQGSEQVLYAGPGSVPISDGDTGHAAEAQSVSGRGTSPFDSDTGQFTDQGSVHVSSADTGHFADAGSVTVATKRAAQFIGAVSSPPASCPVTVNDWLAHGNPTIGPLQTCKVFYQGLPPSFTASTNRNEDQLPPSTLIVVCYKTLDTNVTSYAASVPANRNVVMVYFQEPEDTKNNLAGTTFVSQFQTQSPLIRAAGNPSVRVAMDSATYNYGFTGSSAWNGDYVVPPAYLDIYLCDVYQHWNSGWPSNGLANYARFQRWLSLVQGNGRPLGIAEYGVDSCGGIAVRNARLQQDSAYLKAAFPGAGSPFPLLCWEYWWSNCGAGVLNTTCSGTYQFTDAATIATWQAIEAGT